MEITTGMVLEGKITGITKFGMFVEFEESKKGLVHISEISSGYVKEISDLYKINDTVKVKVLDVDYQTYKISLSIKQLEETWTDDKNKKRGYKNLRTNAPYNVSISNIPAEIYDTDKDKEKYKKENTSSDFEEMMEKYKKQSSERISDMKKSIDSKHKMTSPHSGANKRGTGNGNKTKKS